MIATLHPYSAFPPALREWSERERGLWFGDVGEGGVGGVAVLPSSPSTPSSE